MRNFLTPEISAGEFLFNGSLGLSVLLLILALLLAKQWGKNIRLQQPLLALALFVHVRYLAWRIYTLNHADIYTYTASVVLFTAEIYGFISMVLFYLQTFWPLHRDPRPRPASFTTSVDVFITIYNEPVEVLERTLSTVTAMEYPADLLRVFVLDDSRRPAVAALAAEFDVEYVTRENNEHAKAGNINHALPLSHGELIAIFDCDHLPVRSFLQETVGYFQDAKVAIVQTPHNFFNSDTFQRNLFLDRKLVNAQDLFFHAQMPGRDRFNSAFFAGTSGLIRRRALEEAGGFQVWSVIEDLYTSMELHARGWRSVYHEKILTCALSAESFRDHLTQHQRWTRGGVQVFVNDNPLFKPGLTFMQRLQYLGSLLYFFHGWTRIVFLLSPLPYLYFNKSPIAAPTLLLLSYFIPYYVASQAVFGLLTQRFRNPFWSDAYETADCFALAATSLATLLHPRKILFAVTPKDVAITTERTRWTYLTPHVVVFVLLAGGLVVAIARMINDGVGINGVLVSMVWTGYNLLLLGVAIAAGRERPRVRHRYRLHRRVRCVFNFDGTMRRGWTHDLSELGDSAYFTSMTPLGAEGTVHLRCHCGQTVELKAHVIWQKAWGHSGQLAGFRFETMDTAHRRDLTRVLFGCTHSWTAVHYPIHKFRTAMFQLMTSFNHAFEVGDPRRERVEGQWQR